MLNWVDFVKLLLVVDVPRLIVKDEQAPTQTPPHLRYLPSLNELFCQMVLESEEMFLTYLASNMSPGVATREICKSCNRSRSIYCPACLDLLVDPPPDHLQLPFDLDIIMDDKREHATGVHAKILSSVAGSFNCRLFDYNDGQADSLDSYDENVQGTYLLFPGESSVPLDSLDPSKVKRLVVLDCKWVRCQPQVTADCS